MINFYFQKNLNLEELNCLFLLQKTFKLQFFSPKIYSNLFKFGATMIMFEFINLIEEITVIDSFLIEF